jgi:hypothetical protein
MELNIVITAKIENDNVGVEVKQIKMDDQEKLLTFKEMCHLMVEGISLLIKLSEEKEGTKDYELMKEVIDHLNNNFISISSFDDAKIIEKPKRK